jgi:hypothetical protein
MLHTHLITLALDYCLLSSDPPRWAQLMASGTLLREKLISLSNRRCDKRNTATAGAKCSSYVAGL